ncbi:MAG TPA: hypothetical protein VG123_27050, partial [Streptosporangiaceae bacterium]|nr:hypothetical protein [Streptosporangiaceae bacterium]
QVDVVPPQGYQLPQRMPANVAGSTSTRVKAPNRLGAAEFQEEGMTTGKVAAMILRRPGFRPR